MKLTKLLIALLFTTVLQSQENQKNFDYLDIFDISYVSDPQISPDGKVVVYRKMDFDIMKDRVSGNLWVYSVEEKSHVKLTSNEGSESSAKWSEDGTKLIFVASTDEGSELYLYWWKDQKMTRISQLPKSPRNLSISPDGNYIAYTLKVDEKSPTLGVMPSKPKGAKWASAPRVTDRLKHEADGAGYISPGFNHIFVSPILGGKSRQVTQGSYSFSGPLSWGKDGEKIIAVSNIREDADYDFRNSEIYSISVASGKTVALTDRNGPDRSPIVSPDGSQIAYLSYEDKMQAYQISKLYVMNIDGSDKRLISEKLDRSLYSPIWKNDKQIYVGYDDQGDSKLALFDMSGDYKLLVEDIGGTSLGRPYASGSYSVSDKGNIAYTYSSPDRPSRLAVFNSRKGENQILSSFNKDLFDGITLGKVEEVRYKSSVDQREIQGWVVYPPNYEKGKTYPLLVENHGGPILNYGPRFSLEMQLYAAQGYMVFYPNARGSTSYGEEFGNLLYRNYPGEDYNDVMDGVDYLIEKDLADEDQLFVTGGSAGGIMTAWIIGKNNRFEAAVVAKPVVNWISKTLVADNYYGYANSRYDGQPWENPMHYWSFSPISLVGNIETPTMVMVGMKDLRTPPSEAKQLYHALKLRKVETLLVEIPEASHGIASRPSNLIRKVVTTLAWFEPYLIE